MNTGTVSEELARLYLEFSNSVRTDDGEAARLIYRQLRTLGQSITPILDEAMRAASVSDDEKNSSFNSRAETEADKAEVGTELPDTGPTDQNTVPYEITETIDTAARLQTPAAPLFVVPDAPKQISAHVAAEQGLWGLLSHLLLRGALCATFAVGSAAGSPKSVLSPALRARFYSGCSVVYPCTPLKTSYRR